MEKQSLPMRFKRISCEKCGYKIDRNIQSCPACKTKNELAAPLKPKEYDYPLFYIDTKKIIILLLSLVLIQFGMQGIFAAIWTVATVGGFDMDTFDKFSEAAPTLSSISEAVSMVIIIGTTFILLRKYLPAFFDNFKKYKNVLIGAAMGAGLFAIEEIYELIVELANVVAKNENQAALETSVLASPVLGFIGVALVAPIFEELLFRFGFYNLLAKINKTFAFIVTAVVFALLHVSFSGGISELISLPEYLLSGFVFAFAYRKYGFAGSLTAHFTINSLVFISVMLRS